MHGDRSRPQGFGGKVKDIGQFHSFMSQWKPMSLLDYGCGKGHILATLKETYTDTTCTGYDPAVPLFSKDPQPVECVFSNDVLEHIEPEYLEDVLKHINALSSKFVWLRIDTLPARKRLSDGRNAHLILEKPDWWKIKIEKNIDGNIVYFELNKKGKLDVAIEK